MSQHKDLPPNSQAWAKEVDALMEENKQLKEVVRRLCENAGIDFSNPKRGLNPVSEMPSTNNPVGQKLSSLADVQIYNVADKQVLNWSQKDQRWLPATLPTGGSGINWQPATELETMNQLVDSDSDYYSTQVIGIHSPTPYDSTDSFGLVGTSNTSAFLRGNQRGFGGDTQTANGWVTAQPYYCSMGVAWISDSGTWTSWGQLGVDRRDLYMRTPQYQYGVGDDGHIALYTNWFYVPQFDSGHRPAPQVPFAPASYKGAMIYDTTLNIPIWWDGAQWTNALGTAV